jgi:molybdopterin synthase sulfur carrier subunit
MATVFIPAQMRSVCGGCESAVVAGTNVKELIDGLEQRFPGIRAMLVEGYDLRPSIAVSVDGEIATSGLLEPVSTDSEVYFVPAIAGG